MMAPLTALNSSFIFSVMLLVNSLVYVMSMQKKNTKLHRFIAVMQISKFMQDYAVFAKLCEK